MIRLHSTRFLQGYRTSLNVPKVSIHSSRVSLYGTRLSLHGTRASLHSSMVSFHGFMVSFNYFMVSLRTPMVSLQYMSPGVHVSRVSHYSSMVSPLLQGEALWVPMSLHYSRVSFHCSRDVPPWFQGEPPLLQG
jgi:hypothetical protein